MRIGLFVAYWPWFSPEEQIELARQADRVGLDSVWVVEAWGQDVVSVLGHLTAVTERIGLGSGLMQIPARSPAMTAMTAATLDTLSGGRFRLGLGVSGPQVSEGWHGVPFARPVVRTREYVEIVRRALAREGGLEYEGEEYRLPVDPDGLGKPLRLLVRPVQERIPLYLGAMGPRAVEQTARIADGWLPFMFTPKRAQKLLLVRSPARTWTFPPWSWSASTRTSTEPATSLVPGWPSISAGWEPRARTFTSSRPSASARARPRARCSVCSWPAIAPAAGAALTPELIDGSAICCRAAELDERLCRL